MKKPIKTEDKKAIVKKLEELLKMTIEFSDLRELVYEKDRGCEYVRAYFGDSWHCSYRIDITWDSGIALIRDTLRGLN